MGLKDWLFPRRAQPAAPLLHNPEEEYEPPRKPAAPAIVKQADDDEGIIVLIPANGDSPVGKPDSTTADPADANDDSGMIVLYDAEEDEKSLASGSGAPADGEDDEEESDDGDGPGLELSPGRGSEYENDEIEDQELAQEKREKEEKEREAAEKERLGLLREQETRDAHRRLIEEMTRLSMEETRRALEHGAYAPDTSQPEPLHETLVQRARRLAAERAAASPTDAQAPEKTTQRRLEFNRGRGGPDHGGGRSM